MNVSNEKKPLLPTCGAGHFPSNRRCWEPGQIVAKYGFQISGGPGASDTINPLARLRAQLAYQCLQLVLLLHQGLPEAAIGVLNVAQSLFQLTHRGIATILGHGTQCSTHSLVHNALGIALEFHELKFVGQLHDYFAAGEHASQQGKPTKAADSIGQKAIETNSNARRPESWIQVEKLLGIRNYK